MNHALALCLVVLCGVIGLELRPAAAPTHLPLPVEVLAPPQPRPIDAGMLAFDGGAILSRPLFAAGRRPPTLRGAEEHLPRLAGLLLTPALRLALLQTSEAEGARPTILAQGGEIAGWRLDRIDPAGVTLRRRARLVRLRLRAAGDRPLPPVPLDRLVIMPTKRSNPQLAW